MRISELQQNNYIQMYLDMSSGFKFNHIILELYSPRINTRNEFLL